MLLFSNGTVMLCFKALVISLFSHPHLLLSRPSVTSDGLSRGFRQALNSHKQAHSDFRQALRGLRKGQAAWDRQGKEILYSTGQQSYLSPLKACLMPLRAYLMRKGEWEDVNMGYEIGLSCFKDHQPMANKAILS